MSDFQICPVCGSGKVLAGKGIGYDVICQSCGWKGKEEEAVARPMELGQAEDIASTVASEYLRALAIYAGAHIGRAMVSVGLITTSDKRNLARLIRAATLGAHKATLAEIEVMQKEIKDGN